MQSQNSQGEETLRSALDGVRREYHVAPHPEGADSAQVAGDGGLVFMQLEEDGSMRQAPSTPHGSSYSFVDHLSTREIYQMPDGTEDDSRVWHTYVPRFTGAGDNYRMSAEPRASASERIAQRREAAAQASVQASAQGTAAPVPPVQTQVVRMDPAESPRVPDHPTAEEDFAAAPPDATIVTVNSGVPEEHEDVFVLRKNLGEHTEDAISERTEDDERRDILDTISPLTDADADAADAPAVPDDEPSVEESSSDAPTVQSASDEEIYYAIPDPVIESQSGEVFARTSPDYDLPKESISMPDATRRSAEFTNFTQRLAFKDRFLDLILSVKVRLVAASVLCALMLALAMLPVFGVDLVKIFSMQAVPGILALADMQGVICLFALALPEVLRAYRELFSGKVRSEIYLSVAFVFMLIYTVFVVILDPVSYPLFGSVFGVFTIVSIVSSYYLHSASFLSFKLVSMPEQKNAVVETMTRTLVHENFALDGAIDEYKSKTARIFRTTFVGEFFAKNKKISENTSKILTFICISIASALVIGVVSFVLHDMRAAVCSFMSVLAFSLPAFYILSHKLSYFHAQRLGLVDDATVIGEESFAQYAGIDVVTYEDTEIFGSEDVALRRFKLIGEQTSFTKPLWQMASLFGAVGGPLSILFFNALERRPEPSSDVTVESDGVYGTVDGVTVLAGSEEFMFRHGIEIPADESAPGLDSAPTTKVMYAAEGNRIHAKFYIRYSFSEEFTMLLPALRESGITPLIYTRDPNISNELLRALTLGSGNVRVMKKYNLPSQDDPLYDRLDGGIITMGDKTGVINMLLLCKRYRKFSQRIEQLLSIFAVSGIALGAAAALFISPTLPAWIYVLWHGVWLAIVSILSHATFRLPKSDPPAQGQ